MPSGRTHDRITLWIFPGVVCLSYVLTKSAELTILLGGGFFFSGLMFGPDLDINSIQFKRWGFLRWLWLPYQKTLKHRSWLSHGLILGTVIRLIYLFTIVSIASIFCVGIAQTIWGFEWNWQKFSFVAIELVTQKYRHESLAILLGLELGAMAHSLSDLIVSFQKKNNKPKIRKKKVN